MRRGSGKARTQPRPVACKLRALGAQAICVSPIRSLGECVMSFTIETVRGIAHLARLAVA